MSLYLWLIRPHHLTFCALSHPFGDEVCIISLKKAMPQATPSGKYATVSNFVFIQQSMTVEEACVELPKRTTPRIAAFGSQYFIIVEQFVVCEVSSFSRALFISERASSVTVHAPLKL